MATTTRRGSRHQEAAEANGAGADAPGPDISNLDACVEDARLAGLDTTAGPDDPTDYDQLRGRLHAARGKFPPLYQQTVVDPYTQTIDALGRQGFTDILVSDPSRQGAAGLMLDLAQAILQFAEGFEKAAVAGFQQVASDLYDGFLSAEDRKAVQPPENATTAPLVKFGNPQAGPYTWPIDATRSFTVGGGGVVQAGVVSLPPANARRGILAWAALGHETAGHDILHAYAGLQDQLAEAVRTAVAQSGAGHGLPDYWADRIDETSSDVMGILNMGPAAGVGLIGYFRGLNAAFHGVPRLRTNGPAADPHPADILRGFLASAVVARLSFAGAKAWSDLLAEETEKDAVTPIRVAGEKVDVAAARKSAQAVAAAIVDAKTPTLEDHSLGDIQDWRDADEALVAVARQALTTGGAIPANHTPRIYAAHVVAAGVLAALGQPGPITPVFDSMVNALAAMHKVNPSWGPLFVRHPGNLTRTVAYLRHADAD
jgi:hypothetical protein